MNTLCNLGLHKWLELQDGSLAAAAHPMRECQRLDCRKVQGWDWAGEGWANFMSATKDDITKQRREAIKRLNEEAK